MLTTAGDGDDSNTITTTATAVATFIREGTESQCDGTLFLSDCWENLINMIYGIPPNHPWHAIFVRAVHMLSELGDKPICSSPVLGHLKWNSLFGLDYYFWDFWDGTSMWFFFSPSDADLLLPSVPWYYYVTGDGPENPRAPGGVARWKS